ncbi:hypothetical protein [Desulfosporosinus meridiei]|uniref:Uncharacterized protein n=1 Tax=Desulfosporosinus meridiei (strain ATCC BAA-275 / DSM 13257 / KCTC 12902 / NCIMB 13706 / S10) TaxID=768704 RepID=J7J0G0_DESMD|nr:hypothetical protein [Desulfosporosinus meridiei]AFQ44446.1 hypothetical protein Desmer_2529 [Desulfosporosinus meridiei DSM 13257]
MEAYYHNDPRIGEWVEKIIEEIFTTCLLTGVESEAEFQKGCEFVTKLASLLQNFPAFPSEYLADVLKQIIEQQLPDSRVIGNFPSFKDIMNKMLQEGILKVTDTSKSYLSDSTNNLKFDKAEIENVEIEDCIPALGAIYDQILPIEQQTIIKETETSPNILIPNHIDRLKTVLNHVFVNAVIMWDVTISGQKVFAQVEDILFCHSDSTSPCETEKLQQEGWRVLIINDEDLYYPRRLERNIKNTIRQGKNSKKR